ncbi:MAG: hypothetical protein EAY75_04705, partial [Bacteroidetes bacterium]
RGAWIGEGRKLARWVDWRDRWISEGRKLARGADWRGRRIGEGRGLARGKRGAMGISEGRYRLAVGLRPFRARCNGSGCGIGKKTMPLVGKLALWCNRLGLC